MLVMVLEHPRIRSEKRFNDIANTPLWSCLMGGYAAAALAEAGHDVSFLDTTVTGWDFRRTSEEVLRLSPRLLAINAVYFWEHTARFFDFLADLRSAGFHGHISLFGFFPTLASEIILTTSPAVHSILVGECEATVVELAERLSAGREWRDIPGVASRASGAIHMTTPRSPEPNPDSFPFPLRDVNPKDTVSVLASRGCYNHCSFCPIPSFYSDGPLWRGRSIGNVIEELSELKSRGFRDFYFVDPNFVGPGQRGRSRTLELAKRMRPLGVRFGIETRPNDLDEEILDSLVSAGLNSLLLGIESGSPALLGRLSKAASRNSSERAIELCRSVGIEPEVGFLMFVPDSTVKDLERNLAFLRSNHLLDRLDRTANLLSHCQIVLMGTQDYARFSDQGRLVPTGPLGFEGEVAFAHDRVKWMSEAVVYACLYVLRAMSEPQSPIYWRSGGDNPRAKQVNAYLVELFESLLQAARLSASLQPIPALTDEIAGALRALIGRALVDGEGQRDSAVGVKLQGRSSSRCGA
jgi:anaerobic magnesium-protoporphyrin IX monomethyl ester cyclase